MFTLPTTPKGTALVQPNRGVSINSIYYWSDAFRDPEVERSQVPIRYDPFDAGTAYAMVRGKWVSCVSEYYARFRGRSERELMLATAELRRRKLNYDRSLTITARQLAQFLDSLEAEEILLEQRLRDAEGKQVLGMMQGNKLQLPALASENPTRPDKPENTGQDSENLPVYGDF